jgi:hypothetical protein
MLRECFRPRNAASIALLGSLAWTVPLKAQEPEAGPPATPPPARFEPRFIDTESYRGDEVLLYDWPALTQLVRWSAPVAEAIAREDGTLSPELLQQFRERVEDLAGDEPPPFLAARRDSVRAILSGIQTRLDQADAMLAESLPAEIADPTGEERPNVSDRERTYATGPTAVRVPAGIDVGETDSLPGARIDGSMGMPTYVDLVSEALAELDGLVHMVRKIGEPATEAPAGEGPRSSPDRAPPHPGP